MGYADFGIPHHVLGDRGDDPETDFGMIEGWDMGCRTLEFYVNNLAKKGTRKEGEWPTRKGKSGRANGQRKSPKGIPWGVWWVPSGSIARKGRQNQ